jgi:hypothetical protein
MRDGSRFFFENTFSKRDPIGAEGGVWILVVVVFSSSDIAQSALWAPEHRDRVCLIYFRVPSS